MLDESRGFPGGAIEDAERRMVKTPNVRHSKSRKDPLTIDLEASRVPSESAATPEAATGEAAAAESTGTKASDGIASESLTASNETLLSGEAEEPLSAPSPEKPALRDDKTTESKTGASSGFGREAPRTATPGSPPPERRGGVSMIAAGLIGGVIALVGAGALQYAGVLPSPTGGGDAAAVASLRADMERLQSELAAVQTGGNAGAAAAVGSLQSRIDQFAADLDSLRQAVEAGGAGENAGLAALDTKIADLETRIAQLGQNSAGEPVDLGPVNERIAALEAQLQAGSQAAGDAAARVAQIEQTLSGLDATVAELARKLEAQGDQPKIALSIAASALKAAIDRGQPFAAELETLAAISPDLPQLDALRAHAEAGVATRDDLVAQMDEAANAMIAADRPVDENAGYLDQLWNSAASLVTVRPVGTVEGEGVPETAARMEAALKQGDLAKALAEYETLPENAKAAGADFAARVKARLDVETLADQAIAEAMKTV